MLAALQREWIAWWLVALAGLFEIFCLWSYESPLFIILATPVLLALLVRPKLNWRLICTFLAWYATPVVYCYYTYLRYSVADSQTYQATVLRKAGWPRQLPAISGSTWNIVFPTGPGEQGEHYLDEHLIRVLAAWAVAAFVAGGVAVTILRTAQPPDRPQRKLRLLQLLVTGAILLSLSFPAYLLLGTARNGWRTQFLSGFGTAMVLGSAIALLTVWISNRRWQSVVSVVLVIPFIWYGSIIAIERGGRHRWYWQRHLRGVQEVLRAAPQVRDGTVIILVDVPKANDPFGDDFWFDMAMRLAYPGVKVGGIYFYDDGSPNSGNNMVLQRGQWAWDGKHAGGLVNLAGSDQLLILEYAADGTAKVAAHGAFVCLRG